MENRKTLQGSLSFIRFENYITIKFQALHLNHDLHTKLTGILGNFCVIWGYNKSSLLSFALAGTGSNNPVLNHILHLDTWALKDFPEYICEDF